MSVITTLFVSRYTIHVTDSLITQQQADGTKKVLESKQTKIVRVPSFRGAIAYWGLAMYGAWSTLTWLQERAIAAKSFPTAEAFAQDLAERLEAQISKWAFKSATDKGIGLHFTAYEYLEDRWIPELFLVSNWADPSYKSLRATGVGWSRETHHTITNQDPDPVDGQPARRLIVAQYLSKGGWIRYNNGDPLLYNPAANSTIDMLVKLADRGVLNKKLEVNSYIDLARVPVGLVSDIQRILCAPGQRLVGGTVHDLAISDGGDYTSTSGDAS